MIASSGAATSTAALEARTYTGIVDSVHRDDADRVVAYLVRCRGGVSGTYLSTVLPAHRPTATQPPADQ